MSTATHSSESEILQQDIRVHLAQVLADRRFASAERNANFLRYVVEGTLNGKSNEIKETVIGSEVYGRSSDYDPKSDSIVRVEASRLRQKLKSFYENEGKLSSVRIHVPSGSYVPVFEKTLVTPVVSETSESPVLDPPPSATPIPNPTLWQSFRHSRIVAGVCVLAVGAGLSLQVARGSRTTDSKDSEGAAAWQEGVALMGLDPHTSLSEAGPPKTLLRAIERLEFAVARNPQIAPAWASLAEAYDYASGYVGRDIAEDARRMEAAARRAIVLDNELAVGHQMLGLLYKGIKWEFPKAELSYRRSLQIDPANAYAIVEYADLLRETGRIKDAAEEVRKARALLPSLPVLAVKEAEIQLDMGRPDAAILTAKSAIEQQRTYLRAYLALGTAYELKGDTESALAQYRYALDVDPSDRRVLPAYGYLLGKTGQAERAKEVIAQLEKTNSTLRNVAFQLAVVHAGMGNDDVALDWLEEAWRTRQSHFPFAAVEYRFKKFQQNARFKELLSRVGLKPVSL